MILMPSDPPLSSCFFPFHLLDQGACEGAKAQGQLAFYFLMVENWEKRLKSITHSERNGMHLLSLLQLC